jgi:UDP-glucose 4-epimerase
MVNELKLTHKKILIVGGAGFIGSNLTHFILNNYDPEKIIVIDNLLSSDIVNIPESKKVDFIYGSVTEDKVLGRIPGDVDYVFHLACYHGNQSSIADPIADHENNTFTTLKLFEKLKDFRKLSKVVYAAAGCAVAEKTFEKAKATQEDAPVSLFHDSPYSISKLIGEMYGNYYWSRYNLPFVKARFQNVYGPKEILGAGRWRGTPHTVWRNVIPTFIWKALHSEALPLDNGGQASRDFIFVEDIVRGLIACALSGKPGDAYNLASGVETNILDLAKCINRLTNNSGNLKLLPARDWDHSGRRFGSPGKAKTALRFQAGVSLEDGLAVTVEWMKSNLDFIQQTIKRHSIFLKSN